MPDALEDLDRRLDNWVRWRINSTRTGLGYPSSSALTRIGMPTERYVRDVVPVLGGEANDLDHCIGRLKPELRAVLEASLLRWPLASMAELSGLLGVHRNTIVNRLKAARLDLIDLMAGDRLVRGQASRAAAKRVERALAARGADG